MWPILQHFELNSGHHRAQICKLHTSCTVCIPETSSWGFRVPKSLGWRGFKIFFFNDLFMNWIRFPFMIFLWVQIVVMIFFMVWICFFNGFGYDFYDFFNGFLVLRIWFSAKNSRNFLFFMILLEFPFPQSLFSRKFDFGSKIVKKSWKIVKKT